MKKQTFTEFNDTINYFSRLSKQKGTNEWNQDLVQKSFISMIDNCNLTKEQIEQLDSYLVVNNASLDMEPSKNASKEQFKSVMETKLVSNVKVM